MNADLGGDFSLDLTPQRSAALDLPGFRLRAPRGCVGQEATITGDWLGDENENPVIGYNYGPDGLEFLQEFLLPLQVEFKLKTRDLEGLDPACLLVVLDHEDGTYEIIPSVVEAMPEGDLDNPHGVKIRAEIDHFCRYLIATGPPPDNTTTR